MPHRRLATALAAIGTVLAVLACLTTGASPVGASPVSTQTTTSYDALDPATWSASQLAAQLTFVCLDSSATATMRSLAAQGIGGFGLLGRDAPADLATRLASVRAAAPHGIPPLVASDEEGGLVQRLSNVIYPLPSAETMGGWTTTHVYGTAKSYAARMRKLGVLMDFAPDSDLAIPGYYIASQHRAFSRWPNHVSTDVKAWIRGMRASGVPTVVKHWPGHGQATNTHTGAATVPPLSTLETRDMIPFNAALAIGVPAVMVGHLRSEGLTDGTWPATESPSALSYLRRHAGWDTLIVTDSLSMAAATSAVGLTTPRAAVRALRSGADIALTCSPSGVVSAVTSAIQDGRISRARAIASARRLLRLKARVGLLHAYAGPWPSTATVHVASASVPVGGSDALTTTVTGGYRPVQVQEQRSGAWHALRSVVTGPHGWVRVTLPTGSAGTHRFRVQARPAFPWAAVTSATVTVTVG
ncbi:MAG: glycoside hydrolase family 3 N-terminal domain-containing protein [Frankiaceae bacterium]